MSIRIYALAKQLKLEAKLLLDICTQIGITGKGSALASLTDEELVQLKAHLAKGAKGGGAMGRGAAEKGTAGATLGAVRREDYIGPTAALPKKVPVLDKKPERLPPAKKPLETKAPPEEKPPAEPETPAPDLPAAPAAPVELETPAPSAVAAEERPAPLPTPAPETPVVAAHAESVPPAAPPREEPAARELAPREPAAREAAKPAEPEKKPREHEKREKPGPAIKLAPLPAMPQPPPTPRVQEPAPQKPDLRLPRDAIRASKAGTKPLEEHLRKQEEKRKAAGVKRGAPKTPAVPGEPFPVKAPPSRERRGRRADVAAQADAESSVALGGREQRQLKRKRAASATKRQGALLEDEEQPAVVPRRLTRLRRTGSAPTTAPRKSHVVIELPCTVRALSEALGLPAQQVLGKLLELGTVSSITAELNAETAELLAVALGVEVTFRQHVDLEERVIAPLEQQDESGSLQPRPPIVTFLGHVDHGKTSLLDRLIGIDVASKEKGGITQYIRAYRVEKGERSITFLDTPGHEAFTAMRARGANVTDIAVLVVAADDGVMPQTQEAISHARAADVPIVVALNKMDLPGVNVDRVMQELAANELLPSEWGGDVEVVKTSAVTGLGLDNLLETLLTVAELREYRANPDRPAVGTCLEAEVQQGRGVVAKLLVQKGTLRVGDVVVCGQAHGRIKAMYDTLEPRKKHKEAGPSMPVNVTGLDVAPGAGDRFYALSDISQARQIAHERAVKSRKRELAGPPVHVTLENLHERLGAKDQVRTLNIILRADVRGSIEAIRKEMTKLVHPEVQIKVLQATVGGITEADVHLAHASDAVIIGFNVVPDENARNLAESLGVQIRRYDIIYQVAEDLKAALEGMLKPERRETELGRALVQRVFHISRVGTVAGCRVLSGTVQRDARVRLARESRIIGDYPIESLKREKDDAREVREGYECGIKLGGFSDIKEGDLLEAYKVEEIKRTF